MVFLSVRMGFLVSFQVNPAFHPLFFFTKLGCGHNARASSFHFPHFNGSLPHFCNPKKWVFRYHSSVSLASVIDLFTLLSNVQKNPWEKPNGLTKGKRIRNRTNERNYGNDNRKHPFYRP